MDDRLQQVIDYLINTGSPQDIIDTAKLFQKRYTRLRGEWLGLQTALSNKFEIHVHVNSEDQVVTSELPKPEIQGPESEL